MMFADLTKTLTYSPFLSAAASECSFSNLNVKLLYLMHAFVSSESQKNDTK